MFTQLFFKVVLSSTENKRKISEEDEYNALYSKYLCRELDDYYKYVFNYNQPLQPVEFDQSIEDLSQFEGSTNKDECLERVQEPTYTTLTNVPWTSFLQNDPKNKISFQGEFENTEKSDLNPAYFLNNNIDDNFTYSDTTLINFQDNQYQNLLISEKQENYNDNTGQVNPHYDEFSESNLVSLSTNQDLWDNLDKKYDTNALDIDTKLEEEHKYRKKESNVLEKEISNIIKNYSIFMNFHVHNDRGVVSWNEKYEKLHVFYANGCQEQKEKCQIFEKLYLKSLGSESLFLINIIKKLECNYLLFFSRIFNILCGRHASSSFKLFNLHSSNSENQKDLILFENNLFTNFNIIAFLEKSIDFIHDETDEFFIKGFNQLRALHFQNYKNFFSKNFRFYLKIKSAINSLSCETLLFKLLVVLKNPNYEILFLIIPELKHLLNFLEICRVGHRKLSELDLIITFIIYKFELIKPKIKDEVLKLQTLGQYKNIYDSKSLTYFVLDSKLLLIHFFTNLRFFDKKTASNLFFTTIIFYLSIQNKNVLIQNKLSESFISHVFSEIYKNYNIVIIMNNQNNLNELRYEVSNHLLCAAIKEIFKEKEKICTLLSKRILLMSSYKVKIFSLINDSNNNEEESKTGFSKLSKDIEDFLVRYVLEYFMNQI